MGDDPIQELVARTPFLLLDIRLVETRWLVIKTTDELTLL